MGPPALLPPVLQLLATKLQVRVRLQDEMQHPAGSATQPPPAHSACTVVNSSVLDTGLSTLAELMALQETLCRRGRVGCGAAIREVVGGAFKHLCPRHVFAATQRRHP